MSLTSTMSKTFQAVAIALLAGCTAAPSSGTIERAAASAEVVAEGVVSIARRVLPGGTVAVSVQLRNTGTAAWTPATTRLLLMGDPSWGNSALTLSRSVAVGAVGVFSANVVAPASVGRYTLTWQGYEGSTTFGAPLTATTEVTCSDGVFCNGAERYVNGRCERSAPPCDDGASCTTDTCDETLGICEHTLSAGCAGCDAPNCNPSCHNRACGDDGCGGSCGSCAAGQTCLDGACALVTTPGTCSNPIPLLAAGEALAGSHTITGDTTTGINGTVPSCNSASTARDLVYTFTLTHEMGIDARLTGFDSVLSLRSVACADGDPAMHSQPNWCSDDASPPGNYGSRVATMLPAGTYFILVDGYNAQQAGPFTLTVNFVEGCVPQCDGKFCGDDGCGGSCGACAAGTVCSAATNRCVATSCTPDCRGRQCGSDGCGGECGSCRKGNLCVESTGACRAFYACDHDHPSCPTPCSSNSFCGSDCTCHRLRDPLPDLVVDRATLLHDVVINTGSFGAASCAVYEGCVAGPGTRRLLRFSVAAINQGQGDIVAPAAAEHPELFEFSPCHGHYHFQGFADYRLLDSQGRVVLRGHKQAYCMEDSFQARLGPQVACTARSTCESQGIQHGWADVYGNDLDCQWIDITGLPSGAYQLSVSLNPARTFEEVSFDNNTSTIPVTIP
jgi:hypothetical protein